MRRPLEQLDGKVMRGLGVERKQKWPNESFVQPFHSRYTIETEDFSFVISKFPLTPGFSQVFNVGAESAVLTAFGEACAERSR